MRESSGSSGSRSSSRRAFRTLCAVFGLFTEFSPTAGCRPIPAKRERAPVAAPSAAIPMRASSRPSSAATAAATAPIASPSAPPRTTPSSAPSEAAALVPFEGGAHSVASSSGLVVAVETRAAEVGAQVLKEGGNAVDAAIATVFALSVTHPSAASLGGGGFALIRPRGGPTLAFDFRETAPSALTLKDFEKAQLDGGRGKPAVGVPGVVQGLSTLAARAGTRPLRELLLPAIDLARNGVVLARWEAELLRLSARHLRNDATLNRTFFVRGQPATPGSRVRQPELAWVLEKIRDHGPDGFYRGEVAERLVRALAPHGPSLEDLGKYGCIERTPLEIAYRGYTVQTMPPPSAGGVALVGTLAMLSIAPTSPTGSAASIHYLLEAERRAQAERRWNVLDPGLLAESELKRRRERWRSASYWLSVPITERATPSSELRSAPTEPEHEAEHTTHVSVIDANGMVVSLSTTLSASFGAKIAAAGTGIVLNNAVASFSRNGENIPRPSARTTSSMAPTLLLAGNEVVAVLGTPGGDTIPSTLAQVVSHLVDEHLSLEAAVEAPRWHQAFLPDEARYEPALRGSPWLAELTQRGHRLRALTRRFGDANCIVRSGGRAFGYADSREPGVAIAGGR